MLVMKQEGNQVYSEKKKNGEVKLEGKMSFLLPHVVTCPCLLPLWPPISDCMCLLAFPRAFVVRLSLDREIFFYTFVTFISPLIPPLIE